MASSESMRRQRKPARKANGSGTIKKRKDGRYEGQVFVRTTSGEFKRVSVYGRSWEDCDEKITRLKADNYAGIGTAVNSYTVSQWLSYWLEDVIKPARKPSTYVGYEVAVRLYLVPQPRQDQIDSPQDRGCSGNAQPHRATVPMLRPGLGRRPPASQAPVLCGRQVLPTVSQPGPRSSRVPDALRRAGCGGDRGNADAQRRELREADPAPATSIPDMERG